MFMVSDICEFMCCGCMVVAKSILKDPCLKDSCYWADVYATCFCSYMIRYHGFHYCVVGCCYGQFHVASHVLGMLVLIHFDCISHKMVWPNTKLFLCLWHVRQASVVEASLNPNQRCNYSCSCIEILGRNHAQNQLLKGPRHRHMGKKWGGKSGKQVNNCWNILEVCEIEVAS